MLKKSLGVTAALISFCTLLHLTDIDNRLLLYQVNNQTAQAGQANNHIKFDKYLLTTAPKSIPEINNNLSGLTYYSPNDTLFAITNNPCRLYEISKDGTLLRTIELHNFEDTEGLVYVQDNFFAVIEERRHTLHLLKVNDDTTSVNLNQVHKSLTVDTKNADNRGFEGLAYNPIKDVFFIAIEKDEPQIIKITGWLTGSPLQIQTDSDILCNDLDMDDFSGLHFETNSGNLIFLSDESKRITEVTLQGEHISSMGLEGGFSGLNDDIPQPEGITMDADRTLYVVSEPNIFYCFKPTLGK